MYANAVFRFRAVRILALAAAALFAACADDELPLGSTFDTAIRLTADTWRDGNISSPDDVQWFNFDATASTQYIHVDFGSLTWMYAQLYDSGGNTVGGTATLAGAAKSLSRTVAGQRYSLRVWPALPSGSGAYKIAFNASSSPPAITLPKSGVTALAANTWAAGNVSATGQQWFSFTAAAETQYLYADFGTLKYMCVQVYDADGSAAGGAAAFSGNSRRLSRTLVPGQQYYARVWAYSPFYSGAYTIAASTSDTPPAITLPKSGVTALPANAWVNGNIAASNGQQWFRFTAEAEEQYVHIDFGTLTAMYVQVYDENGDVIGNTLGLSGNTRSLSRTLAAGQQYYVRVWPAAVGYSGAYMIAASVSDALPAVAIPKSGVTVLAENTWANGNIPSANGQQWFRFTATAQLQFIHADFGTLTSFYAQVYDASGNAMGSTATLSGSTRSLSRALTIGQQYYIRVWPSSSSYSGSYTVTFNAMVVPPGGLSLAADTWTDGNIPASNGQQWFTFTATAETQYVHLEYGTLTYMSVQVYDASGNTVGSSSSFSGNTGGTANLSRALTIGQTYHVRVSPYSSSYSGTYRIGVTALPMPPGASIAALTVNTWMNGNLPSSSDVQWFTFTATAETQYIHVAFGTLPYAAVRMYDASGNTVGNDTVLSSGGTRYTTHTLTSGQKYYIRVWPYYSGSSYSGTYTIAFNTSTGTPPITLPATGVITMTENTWANGSLPSGSDVQWFTFTATAETQYFHLELGTLTNISVQVYDNSGTGAGSSSTYSGSTGGITYFSRTLTSGQKYYIRVMTGSSSYSGAYRIAFNTSGASPAITLPTEGVTALTANTWANGTLPAGGVQWFRFTATASYQYIHFEFGTLTYMSFQVYESSGSAVWSNSYSGGAGHIASAGASLTSGQEYYVRVAPGGSNYSGAYRIAYNASGTPPAVSVPQTGVTALTENTWADGNIGTGGQQWFRFTATASTQYIHIEYGTLTYVSAYVCDGSGILAGSASRYSGNAGDLSSFSRTLTIGQTYYLRIGAGDTSRSGAYKIMVSASSAPPTVIPGTGAVTLAVNTWANGDVGAGGEQWFRFTAPSTGTWYIHGETGTLTYMRVQAYDGSGNGAGNALQVSGNAGATSYTSASLTDGQQYYVRVQPYSSSYSGTYRIVFCAASTPPTELPAAGVTDLAANTWANGSLPSSSGVQWFRFTATASTQYIHLEWGTLTYMHAAVYDNGGAGIEGGGLYYAGWYSGSSTYFTCTLTIGQTYYVRVRPVDSNSGAYRILFNASSTPPAELPATGVTDLAANTWANGNLPSSSDVQWFRFTAAASTQYIHYEFGTLTYMRLQVYDTSGNAVGGTDGPSGSTGGASYISRTLTSGQTYYIRVTPYSSSYSGTYRIACNTSSTSPAITLPTEGVTALTANTWANGGIPAGGQQWFRFTATSSYQYMYFELGTLTYMSLQVYESSGSAVWSNSFSGGAGYIYTGGWSCTSGQEYYVRVVPGGSNYSGAYRIAYNASGTPPAVSVPQTGVTALTENTWADGNIGTGGQQWFRFTATASTQYIHIEYGTLTYVSAYVCDGSGILAGGVSQPSGNAGDLSSLSRTLTIGQTYYLRIGAGDTSRSGAYKIMVSASSAPPTVIPGTGAVTLTVNTWANGTVGAGGEQWFRFTAPSTGTWYIHGETGTLTYMRVQAYDGSGNGAGDALQVSGNAGATSYTSASLTGGQQYYVRVQPYSSSYSGTYRIVFCAASTPPAELPATGVTDLAANTWANGNVGSTGEQWFRFTATASTQYIHLELGTLTYMRAAVYDNSGAGIGDEYWYYEGWYSDSSTYFNRTLTIGQTYYIRVRPADGSYSGTYRILFNASSAPPAELPASGVTDLAANTWANGNLPSSSDVQWFRFTATASTQYIHYEFGTLTYMRLQVYDTSGNAAGGTSGPSGSTGGASYTSRTLTSGQTYYIRVTPYSSSYSGTYRIALSASYASPGDLPADGFTTLAANVWANGNAGSGGAEWFAFTATAAAQYIHVEFGTLTSLSLQLHDADGIASGSTASHSGGAGERASITRTLTIGQLYYIRVRPDSGGSGTYKILFNASSAAPIALPDTFTELTIDAWANGNIASADGAEWFRFTATASTQYIHAAFGALDDFWAQVYDSNGGAVGAENNCFGTNVRFTRAAVIGQQYYIRVRPDYGSGGYRIAVTASGIPPS